MDGTTDALIDHCFANNHDDSLEVKAHYYAKRPTERVVFRDNVVWCRGGMSLGVTWENWWNISDITWLDTTIIHHECYGNGDLCVYVGNRGTVSRYGFGPDHAAGGIIKEHYLRNLWTDNWQLW